ncbi:GAF domain-containing protein [Belnapia sp. T18]|uniref:histidine kinase n=1 Tax=Belnapia arida TaxID=2804533 RepID=A0ABS1UDU9_9PROT|nr:GAF domain-containing protein [Belnapia arida]MBL6081847.1 GAF domain-containing protein [Belnapia arida]
MGDLQLAHLRQYHEILTDFGRMAPDTSDVDRLLQLACVQAARGIGIAHSKVMRYRPEVGDLLIVAGVGWKPGVVGHVALGTDLASPPGRALQVRQAVVIDDVPNDPDFRYAPVLRKHGIVSALNVPVVIDGSVWGVLEVDSETPRHFGADDTQFLSGLANVLGLALHGRFGLAQVAEAAAEATLTLAKERTLLEELRHRSKNDLQLVLAMLVMQKRKQTDDQSRRGFEHLMNRVTAISIAHDQLVPNKGVGRIELAGYLQSLCGNLALRRENIRIETDLAPIELPHEVAVALALIVNELTTNALKYAFPEGRSGRIAVSFRTDGQGEGCLRVRDDGVGMGPPRAGSSGSELIARLAKQLGGRVEPENLPVGTGFVISFPLVT